MLPAAPVSAHPGGQMSCSCFLSALLVVPKGVSVFFIRGPFGSALLFIFHPRWPLSRDLLLYFSSCYLHQLYTSAFAYFAYQVCLWPGLFYVCVCSRTLPASISLVLSYPDELYIYFIPSHSCHSSNLWPNCWHLSIKWDEESAPTLTGCTEYSRTVLLRPAPSLGWAEEAREDLQRSSGSHTGIEPRAG